MSRQSQAGLVAVLVLAIGLPAIAIMFKPASQAEPTATTLPLPTDLAAVPTPTSPLRTPFPTSSARPTPIPTPAEASCDLPATLPLAPTPVALPRVTTKRSLLFTSFLYGRTGSAFTVRNAQGDWAMGLWYATPSAAPRLLLAPEAGMVLPLALASDGDSAAVWWLPARRPLDEAACAAGIYRFSLSSGSSALLATTDDVLSNEPDQQPADATLWTDLTSGSSTGRGRVYEIPKAAFSANGGFLAIVERQRIRLVGRDADPTPFEHVGECPIWGWSPTGATFVAGCDDATSAWYVRAGDGDLPDNIAIPFPDSVEGGRGWEDSSRRAIGIASDGAIRLARFFGMAIGCEDNPCHIPPLASSLTTLDPATRIATHRIVLTGFLSGSSQPNSPVRFAAGAAWLYTDDAGTGARTIDVATGKILTALAVGMSAGVSADGVVIFGTSDDASRLRAVVHSVGANGTRTAEAIVTWPDRTLAPADTVIPVLNIVAS